MSIAAGAPPSRCLAIAEELDVYEARRWARRLAFEIGFARHACEELVLVVSELGSNILKYGVRGDITLEAIDDERLGPGLRVTARDVGPPIADLALAITDGYSDRGPIDPVDLIRRKGFGGGLGAVVRLTDRFEYLPGDGDKRLRAIRWLTPPKRR